MEKSDLQRFRNECVAAHNFYRAAHGTPPICWSTRLAESAQTWAEHLASTTGSLRYSSSKDVGENLTCLWGSELNGQKVTRIWYEEGKHFDYNKPRVSSRTRSFCQVVWEGTRELGAGTAVTKHGKQIVVARYFPPMNKKDVARNVKKARSARDSDKPLVFDTRWSSLYLGLKEFHEECLSVHNEYRIRHGAAPLHWSAELAWEAQQWAENLARTGELRHNDDDTIGENLAGMAGGELSGREAVDIWYEELESYDFENPGYNEDISNFTQVVWVTSENLGVGRAIDGDLCVVVAFYEPPGNMEGSFGDNVLRMGSVVRKRKSKEPKGFIRPPPDLEGFRLECLVTHNYFRARHGSPPLVLSSVLTDEAQYWAERLLVTGASEGLDNSRIGISVAVLDNGHVSGIKVSELWYKQILNYDFNSPGFGSETLDFSQLVWLSSRKLGVGKATGAEGVTVIVARYEPVGNIDGLFVQNVRQRGHERGSCEPMIFHVEYKYRIRADSRSSNSFLSWEHEEAPTIELEGDITKSSDLDQFDENKNIVHRADGQESDSTLTVTDAFTRLVWIDPNSPTLQRKGVAEGRTQEEDDHDDADDEEEEDRDREEEEESSNEEDARTAYEQDYRTQIEDLNCVSEEPLVYTAEAELEEADLFSDPEDDLYQHMCEIRRSLSLDSEGTEPERQRGNVLSKVAFFETFQQSFDAQSRSNSESSFRRSLIQDELEELASRPKKQAVDEEEEQAQCEQEAEEEEENECQLEFDDIFPAHREEDEAEAHVDENMLEEECEEDESLVSVSDAEDVLDFTDYDTIPEVLQEHEFEDNYCITHEFIEEEPSTLEIFDFSDEDASHQYADITEPLGQPLSSTKRIFAPTSLGTAIEFHKTEPYKFCEDEPPYLTEDTPDNYSEELFQTSEAIVVVPEASFTRTLDADHCFIATKQDDVDSRMKELTSKIGLLPVEDNKEDSNELADFNETIEGKLLENVIGGRKDHDIQKKRTPIDETCEAFIKDNVESEIDFDELFARLERNGTESQEEDVIPQKSTEIERSECPDTVHVVLRDHESEHSAGMERISGDLELQSTELLSEGELEEVRDFPPDITLSYECPTSMPEDDKEPVPENIEAIERDHKSESTVNLEELHAKMGGPTQKELYQKEIIVDRSKAPRKEESCEAVLHDHDQELERVFEQIGLVPVSPDITHSVDEPVEPLPYDQAPKSTVSELPEVKEDISAEVRRDVRCEINFEELFHQIDKEEDDQFANDTVHTQRFGTVQGSIEHSRQEETCEAVLRDYDQEHASDLQERAFELELVPVSPDVTQSLNEPVKPLPYDHAPESQESQLPEVSELINAEVRQDVRSEINFEEMFLRLEKENTEHVEETEEAQWFEETEAKMIEESSRASLYVEEDTMVDEVVHCAPSTSEHISHESKNDIPAGELVEIKQAAERNRPASLYKEEHTVVEEVTVEIPSSPKHVAGESVNLERIEIVNEVKEGTEEKRTSLVADEREVVTEIYTEYPHSQHIAGETENIELFEEIKDETVGDHNNRASLYMEEDHVIQEVRPEVFSSPRHLANECENINLLEEPEEIEQREDEKRASLYMEENTIVDSVTIEEASSYPLHIAGESLNVDPKTQREEVELYEDEKRASLYSEEVVSFAEVNSDTPLSPKHIACESINTEVVEKVEGEEEPIEQENRASLYWEDEVLVNEIISDAPSSPQHIAGESVNTEFVENVREQTEDKKRASVFMEEETTVSYVETGIPSPPLHIAGESGNNDTVKEIYEEEFGEVEKRASLFLEEYAIVNEVVPDTPSSPKHIAGESQNVEPFEEIHEEPTEERKRASLFLEEAEILDEVTAITSSSPKHIAVESSNIEPFEEIEEEPTEESKRASVFLEEAPHVDEVTTDAPSSPKHIAVESRNVERFEEIEDEPAEESKRASVFIEEAPHVDEVTTDAPSSPKHIAAESSNVEPFEEIEEEPTEESKRASVFLEEAPHVDEVTTNAPSSPKYIAAESRNVEPFEEIEEEPTEENERASVFTEEAPRVDEVTTNAPSSPKHIAAESRNVEPFEEIEDEPAEENERASVFLEEAPHVDEVTTDAPSSPKHIAAESSNVEPFEEIEEEPTEESKRASVFIEEAPHVDEVTTNAPSSPKHIAAESRNVEPFEEIEEEPTEENERASVFIEEAPRVDEVTTDAPSSPKHFAAESSNVKPFEEIEEEPTEESKRASMFTEEAPHVDEVTTDAPSSPKHISAESTNVEPFEEIEEEPTEENERASVFIEEAPHVDEVTTNAPSSPKHIAAESRNVEPFEEIEEEPTEENERASVFIEEAPHVDEVTTNAPSSPKHIAAESSNVEPFEEIEEEPTEENERASVFIEEAPRVDEVTTDAPSSPKHISAESSNVEPFEEIEEEPTEESKRESVFTEEAPHVDEVTTDAPSSPKHIAAESRNVEPFEEIEEEPTEENERASVFIEEAPRVDEVTTDAPSSPKHIAAESSNVEPFEEIEEEPTEESKRASVFTEEAPHVDEVTTDAPSSPKHISAESSNVEPFEEIEEEPTEESKRESVFTEEAPHVDEVTTDAPSSPKHIAAESRNVEPFEEIEEEPTEENERASVFIEEAPRVDEVTTDAPSSPKHIAAESSNVEPFEEIEEEPTEESKRASVFTEEAPHVDEVTTDAPSSPKHIAAESRNVEPFEEIEEEPTEESKRASVFTEEAPHVDEVTTNAPSSPKHIAAESRNVQPFEEIEEEPTEENERASVFIEEAPRVDEVTTDAPSSPKHIAAESSNVEPFEEIEEEPTEESKRASVFTEEAPQVDEVTTDAPYSPKHIAAESSNVEPFEEIEEEPTEERKRASLFFEEAATVNEMTTDIPSSPKHLAGESRNVETFEEIEEEPTEESKRASLFFEEAATVDEMTTDTPSSPMSLAGESANIETFEEVAAVPEDENKRASVFLEEESFVDDVTTHDLVPLYIAGEELSISEVEEIYEDDAIPNEEYAQKFEESDNDVRYGYVSLEASHQNNHIAGEISNSGFLHVTDDEDSPESDYGEHFQEFEGIYGTETFVELPKATHIAGEMQNIDTREQAVEEVLQLDESLAYEERQHMVTTTDLLETTQPPFHIAGELSNVEPREESSEEEKPEEEASAEEIEETQIQASTVVLKSPQSLLSIAAAALEQNIDSAQQDATETSLAQQYSEEEHADVKLEALPSNVHVVHEPETVEMTVTSEHSPILNEDTETTDVTVVDDTEVPLILVHLAGEISDNVEDNVVFVEDEQQDVYEIETERYEEEEEEETAISYPAEEQPVQSDVAAEFCVSEFVLEEGEIDEQREFVEPFEESEEGSVSELLSECSSSPLHVSSELKDFQDYESISEEYGTETYHAIAYEEGDYISEKSISKGLPSLFITEELTPQEIYKENILNEQSVVIETSQEYSEAEEPLQTQTSLVISQLPLQTTAELSDSDYNDGVEEEDELSEREFTEEFVDIEGIDGQTREILKESTSIAFETVVSTGDPQIAMGEDELLDETDNAQKLEVQEPPVNLEQSTRDTSLIILTAQDEHVVHKDEEILEEVWEVEVKKDGQYVETVEEKYETSQIEKFTVVTEKEQRSVEIKSSYQVLESKESFSVSQTYRGESVFVGEEGTQMEISHEIEEKVEAFATTTMSHVSSTTSPLSTEFTSDGNRYQVETNGACTSREEVRNTQEVSFRAIQQTSQLSSWKKEDEMQPVESSDQLSESILDKETKDQELEKFETQFSEEETEVRLLKSEVMEYKAAERQSPLVNPSVTVERETTLVKTLVVQSAVNEDQEQVLMREDRITAILKDDEASLEEESTGEQFEEEIDVMRVDEALSEEEFRGEGAENIDRIHSRSSKTDSTEEIDKSEEQDGSEVDEGDQKKSLYEVEVEISEVEPFYEEECEVKRVGAQAEQASQETNDSVVETPAFEEEVEVIAFEGSGEPIKETMEPAEEIELRTQPPVFEEELEVSAFSKEDDTLYEESTVEDKPVDHSAVFVEEVEVSAFTSQDEPIDEQDKPVDYSALFEEELEVEQVAKQKKEIPDEEEIPVDHSAVFEEELEVSTLTSQEERDEKQHIEDKPAEHSAVFEEELEVAVVTVQESVEKQHTEDEKREAVPVKGEEGKGTDSEKPVEQIDKEDSTELVETARTLTQRQALDLSQVDLYDEEESASATRYYVELSSTESLEPAYEEVEDETCYTETYVRQGDPLEENLEEFILVRYGEEFESSDEEDISDHREIYVIPEEENDVEHNNVVEAARDDDVKAEEPTQDSFYEEGLENMGLEEIRESPEFDIDDSDELDEEEQRQLEEYERLESFVILEEKLSQVESDDEEIADFQGEEWDENVFHSDVHSSSEETLHEDELAETLIASSLRQAAASTEGETSQGDDCTQAQEQSSGEQKEPSVECSSSREVPRHHEGFTESKATEDVSLDEGTDYKAPQKQDTGDEHASEDPSNKKEDSELNKTKDEKMEQHLSSDSSGEQSVSSEGSLSSTTSVDLEGLDNFEQDCLLQHNLYRRQHRVKPLKWSEELAEGAKRWAEHLASVNSLESFEGKEVGENLTSVRGKELNGTEAAELWYKEATDYNFEDPAFNAKCGRFTQVVWASSREFGVAKFLADDGTQYVVARYKPAGNIVGEFKENVKPPRNPSSRLKRRRSSARRRSKSGTPSTPAEKEKFKTECLISHNYYRTFHSAPALRWSPLLAAEAQNYAQRLAKTDSLTHSGQKDHGENLAYTWDSPLSARGAIDMWYDEVQDYDFESPGFTSNTGHFTQLVWVGTEEFGMGMVVAPDGRNIVVGRYFPPGNIVGQFKENVRPREIDGIP